MNAFNKALTTKANLSAQKNPTIFMTVIFREQSIVA